MTKTITLIRHGESEGNVDKSVYQAKPDYALRLTENGKQQALKVGESLWNTLYLTPHSRVAFYLSPFWRTRDTLQAILHSSKIEPSYIYEDARLREQEWGSGIMTDFDQNVERHRDKVGSFFYRFPNGESCADVEDRASSFLNTLWRDIKDKEPQHIVIVTHGMFMRVFWKRWLHLSTEEFEKMKNPRNCGIYQLYRDFDSDPFGPHYGLGPEKYKASLKEFEYTPLILQ
jgi:broad specificity phosphatase PhoE